MNRLRVKPWYNVTSSTSSRLYTHIVYHVTCDEMTNNGQGIHQLGNVEHPKGLGYTLHGGDGPVYVNLGAKVIKT